MEVVRKVAALLIALSLALPQRSCENGGKVDIDYPLSHADGFWSVAFIAAFFLVPLLLLLLRRYPLTTRAAGLVVTATGLYYVSYAATILATHLLVGWYTYTIGACTYFIATLAQGLRMVMAGRLRANSANPGGHNP